MTKVNQATTMFLLACLLFTNMLCAYDDPILPYCRQFFDFERQKCAKCLRNSYLENFQCEKLSRSDKVDKCTAYEKNEQYNRPMCVECQYGYIPITQANNNKQVCKELQYCQRVATFNPFVAQIFQSDSYLETDEDKKIECDACLYNEKFQFEANMCIQTTYDQNVRYKSLEHCHIYSQVTD